MYVSALQTLCVSALSTSCVSALRTLCVSDLCTLCVSVFKTILCFSSFQNTLVPIPDSAVCFPPPDVHVFDALQARLVSSRSSTLMCYLPTVEMVVEELEQLVVLLSEVREVDEKPEIVLGLESEKTC